MDLSIFLILLFVTLQFVAEFFNWNQTKVKLGIFISTVIITLPNIVFMVIEWWQSPHSKIALLVLNTFQPVLRGETYRLFRWLKTVGIELASDDINHLPIIKMTPEPIQFFITRECLESNPHMNQENWIVRDNEAGHIQETKLEECQTYLYYNKSTFFYHYYSEGVFHVFQLKNSEKLSHLYSHECRSEFQNSQLFKSSLVCAREYVVDISRARALQARLSKLLVGGIPILRKLQYKSPWSYFHAAPTLLNLDGSKSGDLEHRRDLVLVHWIADYIAVG
jgi:hypothetical protein